MQKTIIILTAWMVNYTSGVDRLNFEKISENSNIKHKIINGESLIGGGTLPNITLSSPVMVLDVDKLEKVLMKLISNEYPIIPRVVDGKINIDLRSVFENQDDEIAKFLNSL